MSRNNDERMKQLGEAIGPPKHSAAVGRAKGAVVQAGGETWAESMYNSWQSGFFSRQSNADTGLKLRALFKAIRMLQVGDEKAQKKAAQMSQFLAAEWGIRQACVSIGGQDLEAVRALREWWGDAQLPPVDALVAGSQAHMDGTSADELLIAAAVRRLG
jgi:hypothetical protein